ncbi:MAG: YbaL family putative K(+) efflux transporter [Micavibrio sp.]
MAVPHDLPLVSTVAVGLSAAFVLGMVASKLRIPPIVGYLLAGIIIGPMTPGFTADIDLANQLAEIGIVLLMFGVGLHFSLNDLMEVKRIAIPGAVGQMGAAILLGAGLAHLWGWPLAHGLMFGLAMSCASTVVLIRAMEEHNLMHTMNGHIAVGWLIVEDLATILALVLIPAIAMSGIAGEYSARLATQDMDTGGMGPSFLIVLAVVKIIAFIAIMLIGGRRILPWLLKAVSKTGSRELFTLAVFAVAVGLAFGAATLFGVSFALGAFFAGMMIRESDMNHEVADRALPFQDAFAVLFFVAVGMLFNPSILIEQPLHVFAAVAIIMIGKSIVAFLIVLIVGYPIKTALLVSASLAQIGEFSFILAALGVAYGLLPEEGQNLILAGAIVSISLNPVAFVGVKKLYAFLKSHPRYSRVLDIREDNLSQLAAEEQKNLKDLVIVVGYGRVGREVCDNVLDAHFDLVIVDANRERVEMLRELGYHAITGDGTHGDTLVEAAIHKAKALVIAVPDPFEARRILEAAREAKPNIRTLVRAYNDEEVYYFIEQEVDFVTTGPREIGRSIIQYLEGMRSGVLPLAKTGH